MTRRKLIAALKKAAEGCGYMFHTGLEHHLNNEVNHFPALWLLPPKVVATQGREAGTKRYEATLYLLETCSKGSEQEKEFCWTRMEETSSAICRALCESEAVRYAEIESEIPDAYSLTNHGEVSLKVKLKVELPFCRSESMHS